VILSGDIITGANWAQDVGIYEFTMGYDGSKVKARYTFVYVFEDEQWKISHHHSSVMPEALLAKAAVPTYQQITESQVRDLFNLWNNALATLNSTTVAARYSKKAVL